MTGSAFSIGLVVPSEAFSLDDPGNNMRKYENTLPDSTVGYRIFFCGKCGCYLFHEPVFPTPTLEKGELMGRHN